MGNSKQDWKSHAWLLSRRSRNFRETTQRAITEKMNREFEKAFQKVEHLLPADLYQECLEIFATDEEEPENLEYFEE